MIIYIDDIKITVEQEITGLRLKSSTDSFMLENQTFDEIIKTLKKNYKIVKSHFQASAGLMVNLDDLKRVSLKIVFFYFFMYNNWRKMYEKEKNRDLTFLHKDFDHPRTTDLIVQFFKEKYPDTYSAKCEAILNMSPEKFKEIDKNRQDFQGMF